MDTLFRLVSLHQHHQHQHHQQAAAAAAASSSPDQHQHHHHQSPYSTSTSTSTGSRSSPAASSYHTHNHHHHSHYSSTTTNSYYYVDPAGSGSGGSGSGGYYYDHHQPPPAPPYQEECGNDHRFYMDEDFSSSSSSRHFHPPASAPPSSSPAPTPPHHHQHPASTSSGAAGGGALFEAADFSFPHVDIDLDFSSPASSSGAAGTAAASSSSAGGGGAGRWAAQLLLECARAVAGRDSQRVQQLMWMLNELASPYGDVDQKLASYFLQALFARLTTSGPRTLRTLAAAADRNTSFDSTRRTALRFQELSPWASFGHVAANGAILEAFLDASSAAGASSSSSSSTSSSPRLHILDLSNTFCTQWPTLLEALATRSSDDTPHLSITTVVPTPAPPVPSAAAQRVMREIAQRLEKFARLMGVPFAFRAVHHAGDLADLDLDALVVGGDGSATNTTALAINCVNALRGVSPGPGRRRDAFVASLRRLDPRVVTVVEEDADLVASSELPSSSSAAAEEAAGSGGEGTETEAAFMKVFAEGLRFFSAYMDSLEESFPKASNERLALERAAGRAIVDLVACPAAESGERRETGASWARRMRSAGFSPVPFSDDVADDMRSLLRRYREGWTLREPSSDDGGGAAAAAGVFLAWKEQPVVWTSAWRP